MKLNLGCGGKPYPRSDGWVNHDKIKHSDFVDCAWDLSEFPWRCPNDLVRTSSFEQIAARDVLEHLPPDAFFPFFDSCWDLLTDKGTIEIQVPQWGSTNALLDPTHWRGFHLGSFDILDPETKFGRKNFWYSTKKWRLLQRNVVPKSDVNIYAKLEKRS